MEFDWTTFVLEIINFLILVWIMKRFLYHPILDITAKRRAGIEKAMEDARLLQVEAVALKQQAEQELAQWEEEKEAAKARLREELAAERVRMMTELETSIAEDRERHRVLDERRQAEYRRQVEEQGIAHGATFAARLLTRLATPELEARLFTVLLEDLANLTAEDRRAVTEAAAVPGLKLKVSSAFTLDADKCRELEQVLNEITSTTLPIEYIENNDLLAGFQISIGPWVLHANLRDELQFFSGALRRAG